MINLTWRLGPFHKIQWTFFIWQILHFTSRSTFLFVSGTFIYISRCTMLDGVGSVDIVQEWFRSRMCCHDQFHTSVTWRQLKTSHPVIKTVRGWLRNKWWKIVSGPWFKCTICHFCLPKFLSQNITKVIAAKYHGSCCLHCSMTITGRLLLRR